LGKKEWGGIILYKMFTRYFGNPILSSDKNHGWEGMAVFNPGVTLFKGKFYLLYRAIGEYKDYISNVKVNFICFTGQSGNIKIISLMLDWL